MKTYQIRVVKSADVVIEAESLEVAMEMVDLLDIQGELDLIATYYDLNSNMTLN